MGCLKIWFCKVTSLDCFKVNPLVGIRSRAVFESAKYLPDSLELAGMVRPVIGPDGPWNELDLE